jgi:hypothetical protein
MMVDLVCLVWLSSAEDFGRQCFKEMRIDGNVFFVDASTRAIRRPTVIEAKVAYGDIRDERARLGKGLKANICDLQQRPPFGALSDVVPTLCTNGTLYSFEHDAVLGPLQHLDLQLLPEDAPMRFAGLAPASLRRMAGNSMNAASIGPLHVLHLVQHRCPGSVPPHEG